MTASAADVPRAPVASDRPRVGWIGLGRIGAPMAERVRAAGWPMRLWARGGPASAAASSEAAARLAPGASPGVAWADRAEALAAQCDIVCTVVTGPDDVRELHGRLMPQARPGTLFIDLSTAAPATAAASAALARRHGLLCLDAPVTGGVAGAARGTLTCFVGGEPAALERGRALLGAFAQRLVACGGPGSGYRTKLVNQTLMAGALMGLADGARLAVAAAGGAAAAGAAGEVDAAPAARAALADAVALQPALAGGTGASFLLEGYWPRLTGAAAGEPGPVTFTLSLLHKDLSLARAEAHALGVPMPLLDAALAAVAAAIERHGPQAGVQMLAAPAGAPARSTS
jgi:3-hydroxyisobutyrate dehydrogenase-like beta-hydroxyacid dehydrogenase